MTGQVKGVKTMTNLTTGTRSRERQVIEKGRD
jgi:hypothetical protein